MASATLPHYITVAEFETMELDPEQEYELLDGEIIEVSVPGLDHFVAGERLVQVLKARLGVPAIVAREVPFIIEPGTRASADVAAVSALRFATAVRENRLAGAPELVIEILSPSNRTERDLRRARLCLRNGALQFWIVDLEDRSVEVRTPDQRSVSYSCGSAIPLPEVLGGGEIPVDGLFPADPPAPLP